MTSRLLAIASLIKKWKEEISVIDVGSDHAYLSIYLIKNNLANTITNIEINQEPLDNGYKNVLKNHLEDKINFILNDGFKNLKLPICPNYITISGMGASNIIEIIENNVFNKPDFYIVQANNNIDKLRYYLKEQNCIIDDEILLYDKNFYYVIIKFHYDLETNIQSDLDLYLGPVLKLEQNNKLLIEYLDNRISYLKNFDFSKTNKKLETEYLTLRKYLENVKKETN